jgi:RimJ/RimL family protein N-acetyltransferase
MIDLREIREDEFGLVANWLADPEINRWLSVEWRTHAVTDRTVAMAVMSPRNRLRMIVCDGQPVGVVALSLINETEHTAMLWFALGERSQGSRGIMSEASARFVRQAFMDWGFRSLSAHINEHNAASLRVATRIGFRQVGVLRKGFLHEGQYVDRIVLDLLPEDLGLPPVAP